ncbi:MAG: ABC transporter permease [Promethearchaeota archaeon]
MSSLKALYGMLGETFVESYVDTAQENVDENAPIIGIANTMFQFVLSFTLLIALVGLTISMLTSVHRRRNEFGTMRALGASRGQVIRMVFGETLTIASIGLIVGSITGIVAVFLTLLGVPFNPFLPVVLDFPVFFMLGISTGLVGVSLAFAVSPARKATRIDIVEAIRARD